MMSLASRAVANGLRTDHPIPDLPFVDDQHIPVDDAVAIEAIGRNVASDMWGREDPCREVGGWVAFTTDPQRHDLAWCVRWHPEHGRSVILYRDEDVAEVHGEFQDGPLLFRSGGYWWDGRTWYRPAQIWDGVSETYVKSAVPDVQTITAKALLRNQTDAARARVLNVTEVDLDSPAPIQRWLDHLALWASRRPQSQDLASSVVRVSAPELSADELIGLPELAELVGVAASTLRSYIARDEAQVPRPQAVLSGRNVWSRAVALDWVEARRRSPEAAAAIFMTNTAEFSMGEKKFHEGLAKQFFAQLWGPGLRKRWAIRWRNPTAVEEIAEGLASTSVAAMSRHIKAADLAPTIRAAVLHELTVDKRREEQLGYTNNFLGVLPQIARMLDWLIQNHPQAAHYTLNEIAARAEKDLDIPRAATKRSLNTALTLEGSLDEQALSDFISRAIPDDEPIESLTSKELNNEG